MNNIEKVKKHLVNIFSLTIFLVILFMGIIYFSAKYYREMSKEQEEFSNIIMPVERGLLGINDIIDIGNTLNKLQKKGIKQGKTPKADRREFMNIIILDKNNEITFSQIRNDVSEDLIREVIDEDEYYEEEQESSFLVKKIDLVSGETIIFIKSIRYSLNDYLADLIGYITITLIFSIILYFIGNKFVNKAFVSVEENLREMKDFIHNAGHELKTPISVIDSNLQLIDDLKTYDSEMTGEIKTEVLRLNSIIDSLVKLSDFSVFKDAEEINLKDSIEEIINEFKFKISEKKLEIKINIPKNVKLKANKDYFYIFASNLIRNAIKYNKDFGNIEISYKKSELKIEDSGVGIAKEDLPKIFDRFFKGDKSRNTEGFGIGLSLVKKIADLYNWKIYAQSEIGKGSLFIIKF